MGIEIESPYGNIGREIRILAFRDRNHAMAPSFGWGLFAFGDHA